MTPFSAMKFIYLYPVLDIPLQPGSFLPSVTQSAKCYSDNFYFSKLASKTALVAKAQQVPHDP